MMLLPSRPGSLGSGYCLKYCEAARLGPMPSGSMAAICAGDSPYHPGCTVWVSLKPRTVPPGHSAATEQRYMSTPSRKDFEGTPRTTGCSLFERRPSTLAKKKIRFFRIGPLSEPPRMFLSSFGASFGLLELSWASLRKYSLLDVPVRRPTAYSDPLNSLLPLLVTSDTCGPLERPMLAP